MKQIALIVILILPVSICMAQHIPLLNDKKEIAIFSEKPFSERYGALMNDLIKNSSDSKKKTKIEKKLIKFFQKETEGRNSNCANYQLGHYYAFGDFDPYYSGRKPSNIRRESLNALDKNLALSYLDEVKLEKSYLQLIPNTWLTDYEMGLGMVAGYIGTQTEELAQFIQELEDFKVNFFNCGRIATEYCDVCKSNISSPSLYNIINLLKILYHLPNNHSLKSQLLPNLDTDALVALSKASQVISKEYETIYYGAIAALHGNTNVMNMIWDEYAKSYLKHFEEKHPESLQTGDFYYDLSIKSWLTKNTIENISDKNNTLFDQLSKYYTELGDELSEIYVAEVKSKEREAAARRAQEKARKKERRRQIWGNIAMAFGQALVQTSAQISAIQYNQQAYNSANVGNYNALLDPRYAAMQVNNQYYNEYQDFSRFNKKSDGSMYTFNEWLTMRGQAIQNLKDEGYDIVEEQRRITEQQKADRATQRQEDKEAWFSRYGYNTSSSTASSTSNKKTTITTSTNTSTSGNLSAQNSSSKTTTVDVDSKEQYKSNGVSSDDYHFEKHVTLYIRDANTNRVKFSNKDLCKKGANYYVKIDNKYYLVQQQGGWGFNSSILYSSQKLYFNK